MGPADGVVGEWPMSDVFTFCGYCNGNGHFGSQQEHCHVCGGSGFVPMESDHRIIGPEQIEALRRVLGFTTSETEDDIRLLTALIGDADAPPQ
jgi:hypothetical protein